MARGLESGWREPALRHRDSGPSEAPRFLRSHNLEQIGHGSSTRGGGCELYPRGTYAAAGARTLSFANLTKSATAALESPSRPDARGCNRATWRPNGGHGALGLQRELCPHATSPRGREA